MEGERSEKVFFFPSSTFCFLAYFTPSCLLSLQILLLMVFVCFLSWYSRGSGLFPHLCFHWPDVYQNELCLCVSGKPLDSKSLGAAFLISLKCQVSGSKAEWNSRVPEAPSAIFLARLASTPRSLWADQLCPPPPPHTNGGSRWPSPAPCPLGASCWSSQTQAHTWCYDDMGFGFDQSWKLQLRPELVDKWAKTYFSQLGQSL